MTDYTIINCNWPKKHTQHLIIQSIKLSSAFKNPLITGEKQIPPDTWSTSAPKSQGQTIQIAIIESFSEKIAIDFAVHLSPAHTQTHTHTNTLSKHWFSFGEPNRQIVPATPSNRSRLCVCAWMRIYIRSASRFYSFWPAGDDECHSFWSTFNHTSHTHIQSRIKADRYIAFTFRFLLLHTHWHIALWFLFMINQEVFRWKMW